MLKYSNIKTIDKRYNNCYIGFMNYDDGSFDWIYDYKIVNLRAIKPTNFFLAILLTKSGKFWIDDLKITYYK